jgi:hypothetical protein
MESVNLKIQLDHLREALDNAFANDRGIAEVKKIHRAIRKKELEFKKCFAISN